MSAPSTTPNPILKAGSVSDAERQAAYRSLLVDSGLATPEQVELARMAKSRGAGHLDEFLVGQGMVDDVDLLRVTAKAWNLAAVRLDSEVIDEEFVRQWSGQQYLAQSWMPLRREPDGTVVIATAREPHPEMAATAARQVLGRLRFVAVTSWDLRNTALRIFRAAIADEAANELWKQNPRLSARTVFSQAQLVVIAIAVAACIAAAVLAPVPFAVACITLAGLVFLGATGFKFVVALRGARFDVVQRIGDRQVAALMDAELPKYTVLVPVFREANIVAQLVDNLGSLDYPAEKLEVLILTEEEDQETRDAIAGANPPANFRVLTVPRGHPQTKPRACNVGLFFATGEFLVIYDAEDRPDPDQLKKSVI
ncbi:MAG TPA: glycosyltransferase, partial [Naasia sp.]